MVTLASRLFLGASGFALVALAGYLGSAGDRTGAGLFAALLVAALVAGLGLLGRAPADEVPAAVPTGPVTRRELADVEAEGASLWPVVAAIAAGLAIVGVVTSEALAWTGLGLGAVAAAGWYGQTWRKANPETYVLFRQRILFPVGIPIFGAIVIGMLVLPFSRVLLAVSRTGSVVVAMVVAILVLAVAVAIAARPAVLDSSFVVGLLLLAGVATIGGGIVAAAAGEREFEEHHAGPGEHAAGGGGGELVELSAVDNRFTEQAITVPGGSERFTIRFENRDDAVPHNVSVYESEQAASAGEGVIFAGEIFPGQERVDYEVETPEPGTYYFRCDVHPNMEGELVVEEPEAEEPEAGEDADH